MTLASYHVPDFDPVAAEAAVVAGECYRFTVLTPRIVRMEYAPDGEFEDRPSQTVWYRDQPVPDFTVREHGDRIVIETDALRIEYTAGEPFGPGTLSATVHETGVTWHYGDDDDGNMGGTVRTLDRVEGSIPLEDGLLGGDGWTVLDDTDALVFDDGWVTPRDASEGYEDLYLFGYGRRYLDCLADFQAIAGDVPMVPRWALGNWWSRYEDYSADEFRGLMERFAAEDLPLSVCVIDMDWHVVDNPYHGGWTGWTWNRDLFPDPEGFVDWLHDAGLKTTLNIHPAEGVHPHEAQYEALAEHVGIDPASERPVEFDASDPTFLRGYFDHVIDHLEDETGVDFWWIDWQQWEESPEMDGLDPLWALNHLHALDRTRDGRRPFILSRWGGLGGHRYPVGFSGDAFVSWDSLGFQPYLTSTGSNVDFGWWSHDIGGHFGGTGTRDGFGELYARWTQFGALSPINRIHTGNIDYIDKRPWRFPPSIRERIAESLRFRHALIPYVYTMAWHNHDRGVPLVRPMYYHHPETELAYHTPQQYYFGDSLLAAPHTAPRADDTNRSRATVWLPDGEWYDFHGGDRFSEGIYARYGDLGDVPLYAKAGAIVPLDADPAFGETEAPDTLRVVAFPGADGEFELYEDDGASQAYREGEYATTAVAQRYDGSTLEFTVDPAEGATEHVPETRDLELCFRGVREDVTVAVDGEVVDHDYRADSATVAVTVADHGRDASLTVTVEAEDGADLRVPVDARLDRLRDLLADLECPARSKPAIEAHAAAFIEGERADLTWLANFAEVLTGEQARAIVETLCDVGVAHLDNAEQERIVCWNGDDREDVTYRLTTFERGGVPLHVEGAAESGPLPSKIVDLDELAGADWTLTVDYAGAGTVTFEGEGEAERYEGDV